MTNIRSKAAAEYLGLSKSLLDKLRCYGGGPVYTKLGRAVIYNTADLDAWLSQHKRTAANDNSDRAVAA